MRKKKEEEKMKNSLVEGETITKPSITKTDVVDLNWDY